MRRAIGLTVLIGTAAHAGPWTVTGEAGAELDTNVQRVETGDPNMAVVPVKSSVMRFGVGVDHRSNPLGGQLAFNLSDRTRVVTNRNVSIEDVTVVAGNLRWLYKLDDRPAAAGVGLLAIDALPLADPVGARTFRLIGPDAVLALRAGEDHTLTLAAGWRDFRYKPEARFDWWGPAVNARFELLLWQPPAGTKSLELVGTLGVEARTFPNYPARAKACAPDEPVTPACNGSTDLTRRDRYQRASVELTWVGRQLAAIGYQIAIIDSNSFGQSLARHRITTSGTTALPWRMYGTLLAIVQVDQYLDGLIVAQEKQPQQFTYLEDENQSSLQITLAREVYSKWSIEGRAAIWRTLGASDMASFRRELVYIGLTYGR